MIPYWNCLEDCSSGEIAWSTAEILPIGRLISFSRDITRFVDGVRVFDRPTGKVLEGTVDLKPTLDRISSGGSFPHRNDGSIFRNREGILPSRPQGYYREYVHPTSGVNGPGPQRVIQGRRGELYYTPDHYGSFIPLN